MMMKIEQRGRESAPFYYAGRVGGFPAFFYGEEAKVPRFLRGSDGELPAFLRGSGVEMRRGASFLRQNLATFTKRYILKEEKIMHYVKSSPVSLPAR